MLFALNYSWYLQAKFCTVQSLPVIGRIQANCLHWNGICIHLIMMSFIRIFQLKLNGFVQPMKQMRCSISLWFWSMDCNLWHLYAQSHRSIPTSEFHYWTSRVMTAYMNWEPFIIPRISTHRLSMNVQKLVLYSAQRILRIENMKMTTQTYTRYGNIYKFENVKHFNLVFHVFGNTL